MSFAFGIVGVVIVIFLVIRKSRSGLVAYFKEAKTLIWSSTADATDVNLRTGEVVTEGKPWKLSNMTGTLDACKEKCSSLNNCMGFSRQVSDDSAGSRTCYMKTGQGEKVSNDGYDMYYKQSG